MLLIIALCALTGFTCGLLITHWLGLGSVSLIVTALILVAMPWDLLLLPKWLASLLALQLAWLGGNVVRLRLGPSMRPLDRRSFDCSKTNVPSA